MFKNSFILVALAMVMAVAANVIPTAIQPRKDLPIRYEGNNLFIGEKTGNDHLSHNGTGFRRGVEGEVITDTLYLLFWDSINYVEVYDTSADQSLGATPTLVFNEEGRFPRIVFTSQVGQSIHYEFFSWTEKRTSAQ